MYLFWVIIGVQNLIVTIVENLWNNEPKRNVADLEKRSEEWFKNKYGK